MTALAPLQSEHVTPTVTGIHFAPATSYDEWQYVGRVLWGMQQWINWAIGDWVNFGERAYGEAYAQALDATGWDYQRVADCAWVSKAVAISVRNENLTWTHHRYIARFSDNPDLQRAELAEAERYQFTTREFYADLKERYPSRANGGKPQRHPCPHCDGTGWISV